MSPKSLIYFVRGDELISQFNKLISLNIHYSKIAKNLYRRFGAILIEE